MLKNRLFYILVAVILSIILLVALVVRIVRAEGPDELKGPDVEAAEIDETMVVQALQREGQIVLLSSSILGMYEATNNRTFRGRNIPGTEKTDYIQYNYTNKIGIDASDVEIESKSFNRYVITVPEFIFIGYDDLKFETVVEDGGLISFITKDIDTAAAINEIMTPRNFSAQIEANRDSLEDQAIDFYTELARDLDDGIKIRLEFEFK